MQTIKKNAKAPVVVAAFLHTLTIGQFNSFQLTRISENESGLRERDSDGCTFDCSDS